MVKYPSVPNKLAMTVCGLNKNQNKNTCKNQLKSCLTIDLPNASQKCID